MKWNGGQIAGVVIVLASLGAIAFQATRSESSVTFYTPAEVYANSSKFENKLFRVSGLVLKGSQTWNPEKSLLTFRITDLAGHDFKVSYTGLPPDLFKEGQGVIVEGRMENAQLPLLQADLLMVKHSEVYDTKQYKEKMKEAKLLNSILKDEQISLQKKGTKL